jgi:hypothetical protein
MHTPYEFELWDDNLQERLDSNVWTMLTGDVIPLADLTDDHLKNILLWIVEHGEDSCYGFGGQWLPKIEGEIGRRGV